ncbi:MAG: hypothetical protein GX200_04715 [Firmicutes bacterium]|nr:hypothetical protein [Bacillota bacterium]
MHDDEPFGAALIYHGKPFMSTNCAIYFLTKKLQDFNLVFRNLPTSSRVKFYGILGVNYAQAFYWFVSENAEDAVIQIDGCNSGN